MVRKKAKKIGVIKRLLLWMLTLILIFIGIIYFEYSSTVKTLYHNAAVKVNNCSDKTFKDNAYSLNNGRSVYLQSQEIPDNVKNAFVSIEDKSFYKHGGVSIEAIFRAVYSYFTNGGKITQGGSTITQQLARNVFLNFDKDYKRKIEEMFIAVNLEKKFTKDQILEFYINNINFSNGAYGIEAASQKYFSTDCKNLNISQICLLVAIPNSPEYYNPIKHLNNTIVRRNLILKKMRESDYITEKQYQDAVNYKIILTYEK